MTSLSVITPVRVAVWILSLFAVSICVIGTARAETRDDVTVLITDAPPKGSAGYAALVKIAGRPPTRTLELTKCEVWVVPEDKVDELENAARARGATLTRLGPDWDNMLRPMRGGAMTRAQSQLLNGATRSVAAAGAIVMDVPKSNVFEYALSKDMYANDGGVPSEITIPLRDNLSVRVARSSITRLSDRYVWRGVIAGERGHATLMWWPSGRISGTVRHDGRVYVIKPLGGRRHCVVEVVPALMPREHAPMSAQMKTKMSLPDDPLVKHGDASMVPRMSEQTSGPQDPAPSARIETIDPDNVVITVLVAYTKAAAGHYTNVQSDLIELAIEDANQSFRNSGIKNVTLKLVHSFETDYLETGSHFDHLFELLFPSEGKLAEAHRLRDRYRADIALLIVHNPQGCGLAAKVVADANRAFAVVHHECAMLSYSLGHEIGHIIGARHDTALDDSSKPFPYGHGFINGTKWRTMMSYKDTCNDCPRVPSWSNPNTVINGVRAGSATADNARVIREQAARVAAFR